MNEQNSRYQITWLIRRVFRAMGKTADTYLQAAGLTAADRAVMEFQYPEKRLSVPEIASLYGVSRQHVQGTVNRLQKKGLAAAEDNPRHKRSPLIRLVELGRQSFAEIRRNESALLIRLFDRLPDAEIDITRNTLTTLLNRLD